MPAGAHRAQHVVARRFDAADQLDDQIGALEDLLEVAARLRVSTPRDLGPRPVERSIVVGALARAARRRPRRRCRARAGRSQARQAGLPIGGTDRRAGPVDIAASGRRRSRARTTTRASPSRQKITGGARDAVVVVGHRVAVGAGRGRHDDVARARVVEHARRDDHVAGLAVLAGEHAGASRRRGGRRCAPRSARRRASAAGCRTCRRRPRPRSRRCA